MERLSFAGSKLHTLVAVVLGVVLAGPARGQADKESAACHSKNSTIEIEDCLGSLTVQWDKQLNIAYQGAIKSAESSATIPLRAAERAWLEYRKQRCTYLGTGPDTIGRLIAADCFYKMTRSRAEELANDATGLGPG